MRYSDNQEWSARRPESVAASYALGGAASYALAGASIAAALGLAHVFLYWEVPQPFAAFALSAIGITFWYGGQTPGILAAVLATIIRGYLFAPDVNIISRILYSQVFLLFALLMTQLTRTRHDLEAKVAERTADLTRVAADLKLEIAERRTLTARLMLAQDDERRRIAQMLHETTAQDLAALKMHLARLTRTGAGLSDADRASLAESSDLAERSLAGIRTLSYVLHPPFLDETGLLSALRWYAAGVSIRSGISVELDLPSTFERLPRDVETALFRVVQEALINIYHHAETQTASIRLNIDASRLTLEIEDRGRGMPAELIAQLPAGGSAMGVGVAGMRERLQQLGGTLDIMSGKRGTTVRAEIPIPADSA